jgi:tryptophan halogenase
VRCTARNGGWQWRIPLQHRIGNGYVYASELLSDEEAADTLLANLDGEVMAEPRVVKFRPGRRLKSWDKNVVAIGLSSGFLEPLESTSIHLIQTGIHRLLAMFPGERFSQADMDEFNLQFRTEYEDVRDFIIAHYNVTRRSGDPFWDHVREMKIPDTLAERFELFRSSGRFFKHNAQELFAEESWVQVLLGQGFEMRADPVTNFVPAEEIAGFLRDIEEVIEDVASTMPDHGDFVSRLPPNAQSAKQAAAVPAGVSFALRYERGAVT